MFDDDTYLWGYGDVGGESAAKTIVASSKDDIYGYNKRIRELTRSSLISKEQAAELESLRKKIENLRDICWHEWETVVLFQYPRRLCKRCDKEDTTFNHNAK